MLEKLGNETFDYGAMDELNICLEEIGVEA